MTKRARVTTANKQPQKRAKRTIDELPTELLECRDLTEFSALWKRDPVVYNKFDMWLLLRHVWPKNSGRDWSTWTCRGMTLWNIVMQLQEKAIAEQLAYDKQRGPHDCECEHCGYDEYLQEETLTPFWQSADIAVFYNLETEELFGPFSLTAVNVSKKKKMQLDEEDEGTARALKDAEVMATYHASDNYLCIYSK